MSVIELKDVSVTFHEGGRTVEAVKHVTLNVDKGEIFGIVGFSGAGKSTLVRTINLLERPTGGQVVIDGNDITGLRGADLRGLRKKIGFIFQGFNLIGNVTVGKNIEFALKAGGYPKSQRQDRIRELLTLVGLENKIDSYPSSLSGGQKQRVGIARALATKPALLLADEATSALDPETTQEVLALLKKVNQELGITVVVITHEMDVVASIANRVAVMENGRVVEEGTVYDVFSSPQTDVAKLFVATTVKQVPTGEDAAELRKNHKGYLVNVEIIEGNQKLGKVLSYLSERRVRFNIVQGGIETLQGKAYGTLTLELLGEVTSIDAVVAELKTVTRVKEVR